MKAMRLTLLALAIAVATSCGTSKPETRPATDYPMFWTWLDYRPGMDFDTVCRTMSETGIDGVMLNAPTPDDYRDAIPVVYTFIIILLYAVLFEPLGFIISSILCMFAQMCVLSPKAAFRPGKFFLISVVCAVVVYIAFKGGLDLSLPGGVLEGII